MSATWAGDKLAVTCRFCGQHYLLAVTPSQMHEWVSGRMIQDAMPDLPASDRELLISGTCNDCFEKLFPPEEDESDE